MIKAEVLAATTTHTCYVCGRQASYMRLAPEQYSCFRHVDVEPDDSEEE